MGKPGNTGFKRLLHATRYSWAGLAWAWRKESAFRQELMLVIVLTPLGWYLGGSGIERALLIGVLLLVLVVELLNTAVEAVVDRFGDGHHELSKAAKDLGSAAVFVALINVIAVWVLVLLT
ncbi:MAG: diacylglycerol kinase [Gammaproteobacteria bacterium]|jgi:diacylglycerol kinase (ATP)